MTASRAKLAATAALIVATAATLLWSHDRADSARLQQTLERMDRDVAAAKAAADSAGRSAAEAKDAAQAAQNVVPGSS